MNKRNLNKNCKLVLCLGIMALSVPGVAIAEFRNNRNKAQCATYSRPDLYYHNSSRPQFRPKRQFDNLLSQGVKSGDLSWRELNELRDNQKQLRQQAAYYRSDGHLSWKEREKLRKDYAELYRDLNHELNDGERAWRGRH